MGYQSGNRLAARCTSFNRNINNFRLYQKPGSSRQKRCDALGLERYAFSLISWATIGAQSHGKHDFEIEEAVILVLITTLTALDPYWRFPGFIAAVLKEGSH